MKKPDYCPDWFDIDLYDNLIHQSRDELCSALWTRRMNYQYYLDIDNIIKNGSNVTEEYVKNFALNLLKIMATNWIDRPIGDRDNSQAKENYDPLEVEPNIISDVTLMDIACLYAQSYFELPHMREFFQKAPGQFDEIIKHGYRGQSIESAEWVIDECTAPKSEYGVSLSDKLDYGDMFFIDLSQSDEVLKMAFEQKLKEIREKKREQKQHSLWYGHRTKRFSDAEIRRIVEYRVFAYIDLYIYGQIIGRKFTDIEMAAMIYPPRENTPLDFDAVDRISRTVKPKAIELLEKTNPRLLL